MYKCLCMLKITNVATAPNFEVMSLNVHVLRICRYSNFEHVASFYIDTYVYRFWKACERNVLHLYVAVINSECYSACKVNRRYCSGNCYPTD